MKRKLFISSITVLLFGCVSLINHPQYTKSKGSTIERIGTLLKSELAPCKVDYTSYKQLLKELNEEKSLYSMSEDEYEKKKKSLWKGGYMSVWVYANTIGAANPKYWHFTITDSNGKQVFNGKGRDDIASGTVTGSGSYTSTYWTGHQFMTFKGKFEGDYFDLKVINTFDKKTATFRVHPDKIFGY